MDAKISHQDLLPRRLIASPGRFDRDKHFVQPRKRLFVIKVENPAFLFAVAGKQPQAHVGLVIPAAPYLKRCEFVAPRSLIQVIRIKDKGGVFRIEDSAKRFGSFSIAFHIIDVRDIEIPRGN